MGSVFGCAFLAVIISLVSFDITRSLDCLSGHAAACEIVAERYQQNTED
jgi:hypothetical protein